MTAALDLTSNAGERVRKRKKEGEEEKKTEKEIGYISTVTACWKSSANAEQFLSLSPSPSIYPSMCLIKTCCRLGSRQASGWDVKTHREPKGLKKKLGLKR